MSVKVKVCSVLLTKQTLFELKKAVDKAVESLAEKGVTEFSNEPMPNYDMDSGTAELEQVKRGIIHVKSPYNVGMSFLVDLRDNCESAGFDWNYPEDRKSVV